MPLFETYHWGGDLLSRFPHPKKVYSMSSLVGIGDMINELDDEMDRCADLLEVNRSVFTVVKGELGKSENLADFDRINGNREITDIAISDCFDNKVSEKHGKTLMEIE